MMFVRDVRDFFGQYLVALDNAGLIQHQQQRERKAIRACSTLHGHSTKWPRAMHFSLTFLYYWFSAIHPCQYAHNVSLYSMMLTIFFPLHNVRLISNKRTTSSS